MRNYSPFNARNLRPDPVAIPQPEGLPEAMAQLRDLMGAAEYYTWAGSLDYSIIGPTTAYYNAIVAKINELEGVPA